MAKIVVTGGAGFIGSHVAEYFARDHEVVVCDNLSRSKTKSKDIQQYNWDYLKRIFPKIELLKVDIINAGTLAKASEECDFIVHTAGQVAVTSSITNPRTDFEINALGTFNVLEAARQNDAGVIFCSTNKVYGSNVDALQFREDTRRYVASISGGVTEDLSVDHTQHTPYGVSKLAADLYVQDYSMTYGLKTGVFRMSCIYGERQFGVEDQGWLAWLAIATITNKPITIYGNGKQVRDVLYVKDLVSAFARFTEKNIGSDVFNIGGGPDNTLSLLELLEILQDLTGREQEISFKNWREADQRIYVSDITKVQDKLGWRPTVTPLEGSKRLVDWVTAHKQLFVDDHKPSCST